MAKNSVRDFLLNKLFFPKVVTIDQPGVIVSKSCRRYGRRYSQKRMIYHFEDVLVALQLETIKQLGKEKTSELYYKIGKDIGTRYMLLANVKKVPSFLLSSVINNIAENLRSAGMSAAGNIVFNRKERSLVFEGKENIVCRKTNFPFYMAGIISGIISYSFGENIETHTKCDMCPNFCRIIANKKFENKYIPNIKSIEILDEYYILNFVRQTPKIPKMESFNELFRFKKVWLDKSGKVFIGNRAIMPVEIGMIGIIKEHYFKIKREDILKRAIIREGYKIGESLLKSEKSHSNKIKKILRILCAFGWGIPDYKKQKNEIFINFSNAPITKYGFLIEAFILNSILNYIFNSDFSIKKIDINKNNITLNFEL